MKIDPNALNAKKAHDILTDIVMPRPIAFVSTIGEDGMQVNSDFRIRRRTGIH